MAKNGHKFKIERGIEIPKKGHGNDDPNSVSATIRRLQPGESFFVPDSKITNVSRVVGFMKQRTGAQFTCRSIDGGVRIWRLS